MKETTYCTEIRCPFTDCEHHAKRLAGHAPDAKISVADLCGVCRRYIGWLLDEVDKKQQERRERAIDKHRD